MYHLKSMSSSCAIPVSTSRAIRRGLVVIFDGRH